MPRLKQLFCSLELGSTNVQLEEYGTSYSDGQVETFIAVPTEEVNFSIHLTSERYIAPGIAFFVYIDGQYQCNRNRRGLVVPEEGTPLEKYQVDLRVRQKESKQPDGSFIGRSWTFHELNIVSADKVSKVHPSFLQNVGNIEVVVLRCKEAPTMMPTPVATSKPRIPHEAPQKKLGGRKHKEPQEPPPATEVGSAPSSVFGGMMGLFDGPADEFSFAAQAPMLNTTGMTYDFTTSRQTAPPPDDTHPRPSHFATDSGLSQGSAQVPYGPVPQVLTVVDDTPEEYGQLDGKSANNQFYYRNHHGTSHLGSPSRLPSKLPTSLDPFFRETFPARGYGEFGRVPETKYRQPFVEDFKVGPNPSADVSSPTSIRKGPKVHFDPLLKFYPKPQTQDEASRGERPRYAFHPPQPYYMGPHVSAQPIPSLATYHSHGLGDPAYSYSGHPSTTQPTPAQETFPGQFSFAQTQSFYPDRQRQPSQTGADRTHRQPVPPHVDPVVSNTTFDSSPYGGTQAWGSNKRPEQLWDSPEAAPWTNTQQQRWPGSINDPDPWGQERVSVNSKSSGAEGTDPPFQKVLGSWNTDEPDPITNKDTVQNNGPAQVSGWGDSRGNSQSVKWGDYTQPDLATGSSSGKRTSHVSQHENQQKIGSEMPGSWVNAEPCAVPEKDSNAGTWGKEPKAAKAASTQAEENATVDRVNNSKPSSEIPGQAWDKADGNDAGQKTAPEDGKAASCNDWTRDKQRPMDHEGNAAWAVTTKQAAGGSTNHRSASISKPVSVRESVHSKKPTTKADSKSCVDEAQDGHHHKSRRSPIGRDGAASPPRPRPYWSQWNKKPESLIIEASEVKKSKLHDPYIGPAEPLPPVPKSEAARQGVAHQVKIGKAAPYVHLCAKPEYLDTMETPYAVFRFKYRSKNVLEKMFGIKIKDEGQALKAKLADMTKEQLMNEVIIMKRHTESPKSARSMTTVEKVDAWKTVPDEHSKPTHKHKTLQYSSKSKPRSKASGIWDDTNNKDTAPAWDSATAAQTASTVKTSLSSKTKSASASRKQSSAAAGWGEAAAVDTAPAGNWNTAPAAGGGNWDDKVADAPAAVNAGQNW